MKPLGQKHVQFPNAKHDVHPPKGYVNWWEALGTEENKALEKRRVTKDIQSQLKDNDMKRGKM